MSEVRLRPAQLKDAEAIAALHVQVWRETYRGLATQAAWDALTPQVRLIRWREVLSSSDPRQCTLLAERGNKLVGFGSACAPTEALFEGRGEIRWLHIAGSAQRTGLGRRLMSALATQLDAWGYHGCALAVVVGNEPAIAFYEALGGRRGGGFTDPGPLWRSDNIVFVWDELSDLM